MHLSSFDVEADRNSSSELLGVQALRLRLERAAAGNSGLQPEVHGYQDASWVESRSQELLDKLGLFAGGSNEALWRQARRRANDRLNCGRRPVRCSSEAELAKVSVASAEELATGHRTSLERRTRDVGSVTESSPCQQVCPGRQSVRTAPMATSTVQPRPRARTVATQTEPQIPKRGSTPVCSDRLRCRVSRPREAKPKMITCVALQDKREPVRDMVTRARRTARAPSPASTTVPRLRRSESAGGGRRESHGHCVKQGRSSPARVRSRKALLQPKVCCCVRSRSEPAVVSGTQKIASRPQQRQEGAHVEEPCAEACGVATEPSWSDFRSVNQQPRPRRRSCVDSVGCAVEMPRGSTEANLTDSFLGSFPLPAAVLDEATLALEKLVEETHQSLVRDGLIHEGSKSAPESVLPVIPSLDAVDRALEESLRGSMRGLDQLGRCAPSLTPQRVCS